MNRPDPSGKDLDLLAFELAGVRYGLELAAVREIVRAVFITPLPDAPPVVEGVIHVRGDVVPVYDLRAGFGLTPRALHPDEFIVIAWTGERLVAFRSERTELLPAVAAERIESAEPFVHDGRHVAGIAKLDSGIVLIHDLAAFLTDAEAAALEAVLASRPAELS